MVIFWDYDTQWGADRSRSAGGPKDWGPLEFENTERLLEIHAKYSIPACFAVVGAAALEGERPYHDPAQIRRIHAAGHEVGSHSFAHDWLPGLTRAALRESLRRSRDSLEQCIGAPVVTFVPPFNQPVDYPPRLSFSASERRLAPSHRNGLGEVCEALRETGYRVCRVSFRSLGRRLLERFRGRRLDRPEPPMMIEGIRCLRLTAASGFDAGTVGLLDRCASQGGIVVAYGHPHSIRSGDAQDERHLIPFLARLSEMVRGGTLQMALPGELAD